MRAILTQGKIVNNSKEKLKSARRTVTVPGIINDLIDKRMEQLGYDSVSGYLLGLVLYDLWCKKNHALTQKIVMEPNQDMKDAVFAEIAENFGKPERPSSYFEHRLRELAGQLAAEMAEDGARNQ